MNEIVDYTTHSVGQATTDGPTRLVPSRSPAPIHTPRATDDRSEIKRLTSTVEGLQEKVARLEAGLQYLLQERHEAAQLVPR